MTFKKSYRIVNIGSIGQKFEENAEVDVAALREKGLVTGKDQWVKVLGNGDIEFKISLKVDAVSAAAKAKIEKAGGTVEVLRVEETENGE